MNNTTIPLMLYTYYTIDDTDSDTDYHYNYPRKFVYFHLGRPIEEILAEDRKMNKILNKAMKKSKFNKNFKNFRLR